MTNDALDAAPAARPAARPISLPRSWLAWVALILTATAAAPFLLEAYPPIVDMPNHVARLFLECHRGSPELSSIYRVRLALIPNISMDAINFALCGVVGPSLVFKGVLAASLLTIAISAVVIQAKAFGASSVGLLVVPATALNLITFMGYINFLSGVAVLFVMVALLIDRMDDRRWLWPVCVIGGVVLFFCHLFALALGMVVIGGLQLGKRLSLSNAVRCTFRTILLFSPALALFAISEKPGGRPSIDIGDKLFALVVPFLSGAAGLAQTAAVLVMLIAIITLACLRGRLANRPLLVAAALAVTFGAVLPFRIGDAIDVGARIVAPAVILLAISVPPKRGAAGSVVLGLSCLTLLALHLQVQAVVWPRFSRQVREFRSTLVTIPTGAKILSVWGGPDDAPQAVIGAAAYTHLASYAIIDRGAFSPLEFTGRGMQPLSVTPAFASITPQASRPLDVETARALEHWSGTPNIKMVESKVDYASAWPLRFDRVVYYHFGDPPNFDDPHLNVAASGDFFSVLEPRR